MVEFSSILEFRTAWFQSFLISNFSELRSGLKPSIEPQQLDYRKVRRRHSKTWTPWTRWTRWSPAGEAFQKELPVSPLTCVWLPSWAKLSHRDRKSQLEKIPTRRSSKMNKNPNATRFFRSFATVCNVWTFPRWHASSSGLPGALDCGWPACSLWQHREGYSKRHVQTAVLGSFKLGKVLVKMRFGKHADPAKTEETQRPVFFFLAWEKISVNSRLTPPLLCRSWSGSIQRGRLWQCHHVWLFHGRHSRLHGDIYHDSDEESSIYTTRSIQKSTQAVKWKFQTSRSSDWKKSRE